MPVRFAIVDEALYSSIVEMEDEDDAMEKDPPASLLALDGEVIDVVQQNGSSHIIVSFHDPSKDNDSTSTVEFSIDSPYVVLEDELDGAAGIRAWEYAMKQEDAQQDT
tara:strand:+ start:7259 stop:7582 length:324 start_codon:yes stop_codon:yes gene_type:complete